jgi:GTPase Era involved in 16S rRNA processing
MSREDAITLSLISHTNVGKTTLARTLLRRDVGSVVDKPHVTDANESHVLLATPDGAELRLWDTPGFGDSARLLKQLKKLPQPTAWLMDQVWDRFDDRALWCSQQAVRNVAAEADVILYLVNSAESPDEAGYVKIEMEILQWLSKPVVVLLNQTGPPRGKDV